MNGTPPDVSPDNGMETPDSIVDGLYRALIAGNPKGGCMEMLITLVIAILVFALLWWLISILPLPATMPPVIRTILFVLLIIVAIVWLWSHFLR